MILLFIIFVSILSLGCNPPCVPNQGVCVHFLWYCECLDGYYGIDCSEEHCLPGCKHGTCVDNAYGCDCLPGWTGTLCDIPICNQPCDHGTCVAPNTCYCDRGYYAYTCNQPVCPPGCDHGTCVAPGECDCEEGWTGDQCDEPICDPDCGDHGTCVAPDTCICDWRWWGVEFDPANPCAYPICLECKFGDCYWPDPPNCGCYPGWTGPNCDQPVYECGPHGRPAWDGQTQGCICDVPWAGETCDYEMACEWPLVGDYPDCEIATCYGIPATEYGVCGYSIGHKDTGGNCIDHDVCECCCGYYTKDGSFPCQDFDPVAYELCKTNPPFGWCRHRANLVI